MSSSQGSLAASEVDIDELIFKIQALLPQRNRGHLRRVSRAEILKEVCKYIKKLDKEVGDMSERLSRLLASMDPNDTSVDTDVLSILLQH